MNPHQGENHSTGAIVVAAVWLLFFAMVVTSNFTRHSRTGPDSALMKQTAGPGSRS